MTERGSLDASIVPSVGELFREVATVRNVVIEEIVSSATPDPVEYQQAHDEWVVVLAGSATVDIDGSEVALGTGGWVLIRAQTRHRVVATAPGTHWLAVHVHPAST